MSCPMPEIGSCISLISKADIRYEGLLFTVDPDRCTIALARVKSYGTEDRETQFPIAPQNQCYDYILFRGSDIKDIRVINNNPVPNDPAIMQMHLPPQQQLPPPLQNKLGQAGFQPQPGGFMMPPIGGPGGPPMGGPPPGHTPMGAPYSSFGGINNLGDLIGAGAGGNAGGSRSTTPSNLLSRKSPTVDMAVQTNQGQQQQNRDGNRSGGDGANLEQRGGHQRNRNNSQRSQGQQRERRDSGKNDGGQMKENFNKNNMQQQRQGSQGGGQGGQGGQNQNRGGWNNQNRGQNNNQNNSQNSNNNMRGRPRGPRGPAQGTNNQSSNATAATSSDSKQKQSNNNNNNNNTVSNRKSNNSNNNNHNNNNHHPKQGANRTKNLLKFENDYDFEQANNKFEELRSQLSKLKVGEEVKPEQLINNEVSVDTKKDDSGNETGAGDHEPEEDDVQCYDKTKSFFDNISCEAMERAKGKQQRTDWRQERKLNTETFGVGSTRRGGYNRRGGYYNRGPNNYRGNNHQYRGGNNYRGRSHHNNGGGQNRQQNHHQGQGQGQQQHQQQQQQNGLPHNGNRNITNINTNQQQQQQSQQREQQALAAASSQQQQQQQPAAIEVGAGK